MIAMKPSIRLHTTPPGAAPRWARNCPRLRSFAVRPDGGFTARLAMRGTRLNQDHVTGVPGPGGAP
jgi:hypothetical protein